MDSKKIERCRYCNREYYPEHSNADFPFDFCSLACEASFHEETSEGQEEEYD